MRLDNMFVVVFLLSGCVLAMGQSQLPMEAPPFYIDYDPAKIHFDPAPAKILRLCPFLRKHRMDLRLYASWKDSVAEYFVVNGYIPATEESPKSTDDMGGTAVAIQGTKCTEDNAGWTFSAQIDSSQNATLPEASKEALPGYNGPRICVHGDCHYVIRSRHDMAVLDGLLSDALARFSIAFGGKDRFLAALNQSIHDRSLLDPIVRERLEEFEKQTGSVQ
jgi:hypothetical protein